MIGNLPEVVGVIDSQVIQLLNLTIPDGTKIILGQSNLIHMQTSHSEDFKKYFSKLMKILQKPDYVNINPKDQSIKYFKQFDEYVIVGMRVSSKGQVFARTLFTIAEWKFQQYRQGGYLKAYK